MPLSAAKPHTRISKPGRGSEARDLLFNLFIQLLWKKKNKKIYARVPIVLLKSTETTKAKRAARARSADMAIKRARHVPNAGAHRFTMRFGGTPPKRIPMIMNEKLMKNTPSALQENSKTYRCSECGFRYRDKETAEQCEAWCKEHKTCNREITKHAIFE